jgi:tRNA-specific adenosine deaminase 1
LSAFSLALSDVLKESAEPAIKPTTKQLQLVLYEAMLPFIGFGFLDNFVMIIAGEYIDITIGTALGISTMAAAAFGNLISDLFGLGFADTVEALCRRLGIPNPKLKSSQMKLNSVIWMKRLVRLLVVQS